MLITAGIAIYLFAWLYHKIGWAGYIVIAVSIFSIWKYIDLLRRKDFVEKFEKDALYTLNQRVIPDIAKQMNMKYMQVSSKHSELLRFMQIFNDSVYLSLNSKKLDTAVSRMDSVREMYQRMQAYHSIQTKRTNEEIERIYTETEARFPEALCMNVASGYLEKAETLKTKKGRQKYLNEALAFLKDGHGGLASNSEAVTSLILEIESKVVSAPNHSPQAQQP